MPSSENSTSEIRCLWDPTSACWIRFVDELFVYNKTKGVKIDSGCWRSDLAILGVWTIHQFGEVGFPRLPMHPMARWSIACQGSIADNTNIIITRDKQHRWVLGLPAISPPANACQGSIPSDILCYYSGKAASFGVRLMAGRPNTMLQWCSAR